MLREGDGGDEAGNDTNTHAGQDPAFVCGIGMLGKRGNVHE